MRVLILSNLYPPHYLGGYEILCKQVVETLVGKGHELSVLTTDHGAGPGVERQGEVEVRRLLRLDTPFDEPGRVSRRVRRTVGRHNDGVTRAALAELRPDLVFTWSQLRLTLAPARAAEVSGLPVVYTFNDDHLKSYVPAPFRPTPKGLARWATDRTAFRSTTLSGLRLAPATCISRCLREELVRQGVPVAGAEVIHQGIPVERFPLKEAPGALHDPPRILYAGQLHAYKGVHTAVEAVQRVGAAGRHGRPRLTIAGDGPADYRARLEAMLDGSAEVVFAGKVPHGDIPTLYRDHDVFLFPSTWKEPFGLTHLEAMASGTPVVSTTEGGHGELIRDGENALAFEKEDAAGLAACITRLLEDGALRRGLAARARAIVEKEFSLARYVDDLERFLVEAAGKEGA